MFGTRGTRGMRGERGVSSARSARGTRAMRGTRGTCGTQFEGLERAACAARVHHCGDKLLDLTNLQCQNLGCSIYKDLS